MSRSPGTGSNPGETPLPPRRLDVARVELVISYLLRAGVLCATLLIVAGIILGFAHHPGWLSSPDQLRELISGQRVLPHTLAEVWDGLLHGRGQALVLLGLMVLIATPVMRVAVSVAAFMLQGDRVFVAITLVVLLFLLLSFAIGKAGG